MKTKKLIAFEGLPGGGKTTIAKMFAEHLNGEFMEEIVSHDRFLPTEDEYYIESELIKLGRFTKTKKLYSIFDRSLISMIAYNYGKKGLETDNILNRLNQLVVGTRKPDLFVYLRISNLSLCNERKDRDVNENDIWTRNDALLHIYHFYEDYFSKEKNTIVIDTDHRTVEESYQLLINEFNKHVEKEN